MLRLPPFGSLVAAVLLAVLGTLQPAHSAGSDPKLVYDSEFQGYVPVVAGVARPDMVTTPGDGRVPTDLRDALKRARRSAKRGTEWDELAGETGSRDRDEEVTSSRRGRRWVRRVAVESEIRVTGRYDQPISGARVYRYTDPSFYAVSEDDRGARLFGSYRFLPYPFPAIRALTTVKAHEEHWLDRRMLDVVGLGPDIDFLDNPWSRGTVEGPSTPVEFVGRTDADGRLLVRTGLHNLRDDERFPHAIVPSVIRLGFVVVADGHQAAISERRLADAGTEESREVALLEEPGAEVYGSVSYAAALRLADAISLRPGRTFAGVSGEIDDLLATLEPMLARVPEERRDTVRREAEARIVSRIARRASPRLALLLARRAVRATPDHAARRHRLARMLVDAEKTVDTERAEGAPISTSLEEAAELLEGAMSREPSFLPSYALLHELTLASGDEEAAVKLVRRLLFEHPFDKWGRARLAERMLEAGRPVEAFDHLRYTWSMIPGLGGDLDLAQALADHYWRMGLTEKAALFGRLVTGRDPEDPTARAGSGTGR